MSTDAATPTAAVVDLTTCDREPIHIPGSIQAHGVLLVLQEPQLAIVQVSQNTLEFLGLPPEDFLGRHLADLMTPDQLQAIHGCLAADFDRVNPMKLTLGNLEPPRRFDGILHRSGEHILLELEPAQTPAASDFFSFYRLVRGAIARIQQVTTLPELCQVLAEEIRTITGFDRVMIYQFDTSGAGAVVAEAKAAALSSYLGLHYPASDIPQQAKHLYTLNLLRLIPDVTYQPVGLVPADDPDRPLDLSLAVLRSVSPIHIEYLHNMGVSASMSVSLVQAERLWGLIACHHTSPKYLSYELRTACEFLGQVMALELKNKEDNDDLDYKVQLKALQSHFITTLSQAESLGAGLAQNPQQLLALTGAEGVAVAIGQELTLIGQTPAVDAIRQLIPWIESQIPQEVIFHSDALPLVYPAAQKFRAVGSGVLALAISKVQQNYILWFRPEVVQTVNWGGNPYKPVEVEPDGELQLSPRKSFELWKETVQLHSLPWKRCEIEAALELRSAIVGIVLCRADELTKINIDLERSNSELDAFAYIASHDLKEPLRGIHNYSNFLIEDYGEILDQDGVAKLQTLVRLTQRMEDLIDSLLHFSRLGRIELSLQMTDLNSLLKHVIEVLNISQNAPQLEIRIPRPLPSIRCDRVQVSEVFTNLLSNAIKYNDKPEKWVEIGFLEAIAINQMPAGSTSELEAEVEGQPQAAIIFYVRDNGIGIREKHQEAIFRIFKRLHGPGKYGGGTGAGLTIAKKIVERHGGKIWVESTFGVGSTFYFTFSN